jgi:N-acetylglucosaminyl-diphospho-decaprenol L-rhamnosyltransferase
MATAEAVATVSVVVVTYDALPWLERCLESVREYETVVVDHGSTDGTLELVRERFPDVRLVEQPNRGLAAGWNRGMREVSGGYFLILNADAWMNGNAIDRLAAFLDDHPRAALVGPRLRNPDGTLQRSVRGFPTLWRLATEYAFLRKLAPRSRVMNAFYAGGFDHDETREAEFVMGACMLVRREADEQVGQLDEAYFMFSEETDWCYRFRQAGWKVYFFPGAEATHVGGHAWRRDYDPMYREQLRGHLRFFTKHYGRRKAEQARMLLLASMRLRSVVFRGGRRRTSREAASWLRSSSARELVDSR